MTGMPIWRPAASSIRHVASDSNPFSGEPAVEHHAGVRAVDAPESEIGEPPARDRSASASGGQKGSSMIAT